MNAFAPVASPKAKSSPSNPVERLRQAEQELARLQKSHKKLREELLLARRREGQLLHAITENVPIVIGRTDKDGCVVEACGDRLCSGITATCILGRCLARLFPEVKTAIELALAGKHGNCEIWSGEEREQCVEFYAFPDASGAAAVVFFARDISTRKNLERRLLTISDAEQQRIGADLHDGLGQHLTGIACMAAALREKLDGINPACAAEAGSIVSHVNATIDMTRGLARGLCPVKIEKESLSRSLEDFCFQIQRLHRVKCHVRQVGQHPRLDQPAALHLYRIAQEAVNNVVRHSEADQIVVTLRRSSLAIEDNGEGFDPELLSNSGSLGLRLMEYRASLIGGSLRLSRRRGRGMRVECVFPRPAENPEV